MPKYTRLEEYPTGATAWVCRSCGAVVHHDYINFHEKFHAGLVEIFDALV